MGKKWSKVQGNYHGDSLATIGAPLGRRTYQDFYAVWPKRKVSPFSALLDNMQKYIASTTLSEPLMRSYLVDEYVLLIHPLILGSGRRLFPEGSAFATLRLVTTKTTSTGVVIMTYQPAELEARSTTEALPQGKPFHTIHEKGRV